MMIGYLSPVPKIFKCHEFQVMLRARAKYPEAVREQPSTLAVAAIAGWQFIRSTKVPKLSSE
jgi:hypothetical protein